MKPGIYGSLSNEAYHGGPGESKSLLDKMRTSPAHYRAVTTPAANDEPDALYKPTPAQEFGTAFHALLLEPGEFPKQYTLGLRRQDVEGHVVDSRDELVAMVEELNKGRKAKLATSGSKDELVERIRAAEIEMDGETGPAEHFAGMKQAELKSCIEHLNERRQGMLPTTGNMDTLAQMLRDAGRQFTLWSEAKAEWSRNNGHITVLTPEQWDQLHRMRDAVMAHPAARALLSRPGVAERSVYWVDPTTGLLCRCRPDWWLMQEGILVDLKTTEDAGAESFARSIAKWRYHVQQAFYSDGINLMREQAQPDPFGPPMPAKVHAFVFLAVEKDARVVDGQALGVAVYCLDADSVELGRREYMEDLANIAECKRVGRFPGYGNAVQGIELPRWKKAAAANDNDTTPSVA